MSDSGSPHSAHPRAKRLWQVGVAYAVVGLAIIGGANDILPNVGLGEVALTWVIAVVALGLPVALLLTWRLDRSELASVAAEPRAARFDRLPAHRRLAVLPLLSIDAEEGQEYFADGMTEELIGVLSRSSGLDVIARTSVMRYRGSPRSVREIGEDLTVGVVLEGSVRRAGSRLRVTVRLVDAESERPLWSDDFDREIEDVFAIQSDIARGVAAALKVTLREEHDELLHREPTSDLSAYDLYLLGRHHLSLRTEDGIRQAIQHFESALDRDSAFALAWSGLADGYVLALVGYASIPAKEAIRRGREAAEEALALDESLADPHVSLGYLETNRWRWEPARAEFERALELSPSHAQAHQWFAHYLIYRGDLHEAVEYAERASTLDPLANVILNETSWPYLYLGRFEEAAERSQKVIHRDPEYAMAYLNLGNAAEALGRFEEAVTYYRAAGELSARVPFITAFLGMALVRIGDRENVTDLIFSSENRLQDQCLSNTHK